MKTKHKINKWSILLGVVGIAIIIASTIQWFFLFQDYSQLAIAGGIGVVCLGFAYIYDIMKRYDEQVAEFHGALDAINIYFRDEIEKLKREKD